MADAKQNNDAKPWDRITGSYFDHLLIFFYLVKPYSVKMLEWAEDDELEGIWNEVVVVYFMIVTHNILWETSVMIGSFFTVIRTEQLPNIQVYKMIVGNQRNNPKIHQIQISTQQNQLTKPL
jgi:hypothetical protein